MTVRSAEIAAWHCVREVVMDHLARRRAEVDDRLGLSFIKVKALLRLAHGPLTMGDLALALNIDPPYTSVVVDDLVHRELVARSAHPGDRRRKLVDLTRTGRQFAEIADAILDQPPAGFADMDAEELRVLSILFARVGAESLTSG